MGIYFENGRYLLRWTGADGRRRWKTSTAETKTEAKRQLRDLQRKVEFQRLGLQPLSTDTALTLGELCTWWLEHRCPEASREIESRRLAHHVLKKPIGALPLPHVTSERVEELFCEMESGGAAPASVNKLRAILHVVFSKARKSKRWLGANPVSDVEARRVTKKTFGTLRAEEVPLLLPHVESEWRNLFAAALYTGLRKGELCGLLKSDVDLPERVLMVARSYDRDTTKGGHADALPIAEPLVPYLEDALARSPSQWVFPAADGSMRTHESDPQKVLRTALGRAGLVEGYDHVCRRCKAAECEPHTFRHPDPAIRRCPTCEMKLWPRPLPRNMRFHDLRHSVGTLLLRAGVDAHRVQRILRHADIRVTLGTYGHLDVEDLREAVNAITPALPTSPAPFEPVRAAASAESPPTGRFSVGTSEERPDHARSQDKNPSTNRELPNGRTRFRTWDPCRVNADSSLTNGSEVSPTLTTAHNHSESRDGESQPSQPFATGSRPTGRFSVGRSEQVPARLRSVRGLADRLLPVREVAALLSVSTATVYALIERGELPHVRISNSIRVAPAGLEGFIRGRKR